MKRFIFGVSLITIFLTVIFISSKILYAPSYKIRFNTNGGSVVESIEVRENKKLDKLPITTKENYEFVGWFNGDEPFNLDIDINKDYTLNAKWKEMEAKNYLVSFDSLGGTNIATLSLKENTKLTEFPIPEKEGFKFISWMYKNKEVKELNITKDIVLIAKWRKIID